MARCLLSTLPSPSAASALDCLLPHLLMRGQSLLRTLASTSTTGAHLDPKAEELVRESQLGRVLAPTLSMLYLLSSSSSHNGKKEGEEARCVKRLLRGLAPHLGPLAESLGPVLKLLTPSERESEVARRVSRTETIVIESEHEYRNNTHDKIKLHIPHAKSLTLTFSSETSTEATYDYVRLFQDEDMSLSLHPEHDKFSGSECWPGKGLPPLEVKGDTAWLLWHTDGTNVDWGWKLTISGHVGFTQTSRQGHWLVQLERSVALLGGQVVEQLLSESGARGKGEREEGRHAAWFDDPVLCTLPQPHLLDTYLPHLSTHKRGHSRQQSSLGRSLGLSLSNGSIEQGRSQELEMPLTPRMTSLQQRHSGPGAHHKGEPGQLLAHLVRPLWFSKIIFVVIRTNA
jgi:hypothetical protein